MLIVNSANRYTARDLETFFVEFADVGISDITVM
jgi:hypothetical protein